MKAFGIRPEIEIFDLSHLHGARRLVDKGLMDDQPHIQFVMGVQNALPAEERLLDILLKEAKTLFPNCTWTAAGIGRHQAKVMDWALFVGRTRSGPAWRTTSASPRTGSLPAMPNWSSMRCWPSNGVVIAPPRQRRPALCWGVGPSPYLRACSGASRSPPSRRAGSVPRISSAETRPAWALRLSAIVT